MYTSLGLLVIIASLYLSAATASYVLDNQSDKWYGFLHHVASILVIGVGGVIWGIVIMVSY